MKLNTAIIGFGVVGKRRKEFIEKNKNYNLIAISDIKFKKDFHRKNISYFKNYDDVFNSNLNINCIYVTLPNYLSAKVTKFALKKKYMYFVKNHQLGIIKNC